MRVLLKNVQQILAVLFQSKNRDKLQNTKYKFQISKIPIQYLLLVSRHSSLITTKK
jgi:hypothetical protein